jgi:hypothetical protein
MLPEGACAAAGGPGPSRGASAAAPGGSRRRLLPVSRLSLEARRAWALARRAWVGSSSRTARRGAAPRTACKPFPAQACKLLAYAVGGHVPPNRRVTAAHGAAVTAAHGADVTAAHGADVTAAHGADVTAARPHGPRDQRGGVSRRRSAHGPRDQTSRRLVRAAATHQHTPSSCAHSRLGMAAARRVARLTCTCGRRAHARRLLQRMRGTRPALATRDAGGAGAVPALATRDAGGAGVFRG